MVPRQFEARSIIMVLDMLLPHHEAAYAAHLTAYFGSSEHVPELRAAVQAATLALAAAHNKARLAAAAVAGARYVKRALTDAATHVCITAVQYDMAQERGGAAAPALLQQEDAERYVDVMASLHESIRAAELVYVEELAVWHRLCGAEREAGTFLERVTADAVEAFRQAAAL